jgi:hypothetical protein
VERAFAFGGVAALRAGSLRGFMIAGPSFDFRGSTAALVPEYAHAVAEGEEGALVGSALRRGRGALGGRGRASCT